MAVARAAAWGGRNMDSRYFDDAVVHEGLRLVPAPSQRHWTMLDNAYVDTLMRTISAPAMCALIYLTRETVGYHRESVRASFAQLAEALGCTRNTAMRAVQELEAAHVVATVGQRRGRTQARTFTLLPEEAWTL